MANKEHLVRLRKCLSVLVTVFYRPKILIIIGSVFSIGSIVIFQYFLVYKTDTINKIQSEILGNRSSMDNRAMNYNVSLLQQNTSNILMSIAHGTNYHSNVRSKIYSSTIWHIDSAYFYRKLSVITDQEVATSKDNTLPSDTQWDKGMDLLVKGDETGFTELWKVLDKLSQNLLERTNESGKKTQELKARLDRENISVNTWRFCAVIFQVVGLILILLKDVRPKPSEKA